MNDFIESYAWTHFFQNNYYKSFHKLKLTAFTKDLDAQDFLWTLDFLLYKLLIFINIKEEKRNFKRQFSKNRKYY